MKKKIYIVYYTHEESVYPIEKRIKNAFSTKEAAEADINTIAPQFREHFSVKETYLYEEL